MFFAYTEWCGGMYASPTMTGSRSGGLIAGAWAAIMLNGEDGYLEIAKEIWKMQDTLVKGIQSIDGLVIVGPPDAACVSFRCSSGPSSKPYQVAVAMKEVGEWNLNYMQNPVCCQVQIGYRQHGWDADKFVTDLREALARVDANPEKYSGGLAKIYGMACDMGDREVVSDLLIGYLDEMYKV